MIKKIFLTIILLSSFILKSQTIEESLGYKSNGLTTTQLNALPASVKVGLVIRNITIGKIVAWDENLNNWVEVGSGTGGGSDDDITNAVLNGTTLELYEGATVVTVDLASLASGSSNTFNDTAEIDFTDTSGTITADIANSSIDESKLDTSTNASLDLADTSIQPSDNVSELINDAGYITSSQNTTNIALETNGSDLRVRDSEGNSVSIAYSEIASNVGPLITDNDTQLTEEQVQDFVGNLVSASSDGLSYSDAGNNLTVDDSELQPDWSNIQNIPAGFADGVDNTGGAGSDGVVSNVALNGTDLDFTGSDGGFNGSVDLGSLQDGTGTDDQNLVLTGDVLSIEGGTGSVDLSTYSDGFEANTDSQNLSLSGNTVNISGGTGVDLTPILGGGTDDQTLSEVLTQGNTTGSNNIDFESNGSLLDAITVTAGTVTAPTINGNSSFTGSGGLFSSDLQVGGRLLLGVNGIRMQENDVVTTGQEGDFYADDSENRLKYHDGTGFKALAFQDEIGSGSGITTGVKGDINVVGVDTDWQLVANAVGTPEIVDLAVTTDKIAGDAITNTRIADNAVRTEHIQDNSVSLAKIDDISQTEGHVIKIVGGEATWAAEDSGGSGGIQSPIAGRTGQTINSAMIQTQTQFDADGATAVDELVIIDDPAPATVVTGTIIDFTDQFIVMIDDTQIDSSSFDFQNCKEGKVAIIYTNQSSEPSFTGTGLTFRQAPDTLDWTTDALADTAVKAVFEVTSDPTVIDWTWVKR